MQPPCKRCGGSGLEPDAAALVSARESAGVTQNQVARLMGISPQWLCDLEHGRRDWRAELVVRFRTALNVAREEREKQQQEKQQRKVRR